MGTKTMTLTPTVEELLKTPTGAKILAELADLEKRAEAEKDAEKRKQLDALNVLAKELLPALEAARVVVLGQAENLVASFAELDAIFSDARSLKSRFKQLGSGLTLPESKLDKEVANLVADLQSCARRFGRPI